MFSATTYSRANRRPSAHADSCGFAPAMKWVGTELVGTSRIEEQLAQVGGGYA